MLVVTRKRWELKKQWCWQLSALIANLEKDHRQAVLHEEDQHRLGIRLLASLSDTEADVANQDFTPLPPDKSPILALRSFTLVSRLKLAEHFISHVHETLSCILQSYQDLKTLLPLMAARIWAVSCFCMSQWHSTRMPALTSTMAVMFSAAFHIAVCFRH